MIPDETTRIEGYRPGDDVSLPPELEEAAKPVSTKSWFKNITPQFLNQIGPSKGSRSRSRLHTSRRRSSIQNETVDIYGRARNKADE